MKKNMKRVVTILLVLLIVTAGIGAYFVGTDTKSDSYTIGQIEVEVVGDDNLYEALRLTPNYEYTFTRSVKNIGINDAYVFMAITIPYEKVYTHDANGNQVEAGLNELMDVQLFTYGTDGAAGVSSEWAPVTAGQFGDYDIALLDGSIKNTSGEYGAKRANKTITYIYAYVGDNGNTLERLAPDAMTDAIFDIMKFADVNDTTEDYNLEGASGQIKTQVFAIQADNVLETDPMTGDNADGSEAINAVWQVLNTATNDKSLSATDADEIGDKTVKLTIVDQNGAASEGAVVRLTATDGSGKYVEGTTDASGVVIFVGDGQELPKGNYDMSVQILHLDRKLYAPLNADELGQLTIQGDVERTISVVVPPIGTIAIMDSGMHPEEIISITINDGEERTIYTPGIEPMNENPVIITLNNASSFRIVSFTTASGTYYLDPPTDDDLAYTVPATNGCAFENGEFVIGADGVFQIGLMTEEPPEESGPLQ